METLVKGNLKNDEHKFDELYIATLILESKDESFSQLLKIILDSGHITPLLLKLIIKRTIHLIYSLDFRDTKVSNSTLKFINGIKIKSLNLSNCKTITNNSLFHINGNESLEELLLHKCNQIGNYGLNQIFLQNLKILDLSDTSIDEYALDLILRKFKELRSLNLSRTPISDKSMESLLLYEDNKIQQLILNGCRNVTPSSIYALSSLKCILKLNLTGTGFNKISINKLKDMFNEKPDVLEVTTKVVYQLNLKYKDSKKNELYHVKVHKGSNNFISAQDFSRLIIESEPYYDDISLSIDIETQECVDENKSVEDETEQDKVSEPKTLPKEEISVFEFDDKVKRTKQKKRTSHQYEPLKIVNAPSSVSLATIGCSSGDMTSSQVSAEPFIHKSTHYKLKNLVYEM